MKLSFSQYMVTDNEKMVADENPFILVTDRNFSIQDVLPLLEEVLKSTLDHCLW